MLTEKEIKKNKKYFNYLEGLRESGVTNMYGAGPYLEKFCFLEEVEANKVLAMWMENYDQLSKELHWERD